MAGLIFGGGVGGKLFFVASLRRDGESPVKLSIASQPQRPVQTHTLSRLYTTRSLTHAVLLLYGERDIPGLADACGWLVTWAMNALRGCSTGALDFRKNPIVEIVNVCEYMYERRRTIVCL